MPSKRDLNSTTSERLAQIIKKTEVQPRWFNWRWNFFNRLHIKILKIRGAKNVLWDLEKSGLSVPKFSWVWKLAIDLRHDLNRAHFNDALIVLIINDYYAYEKIRIEGKIGLLGRPGFKQYNATISILDSTSRELYFLKENESEKFDTELKIKISYCVDNLAELTSEDNSSLFIEYKELDRPHTFYYLSLLSLLRTFDGFKAKSRRSKVIGPLNLNQSDFAAVFHYATLGEYYKRSDLDNEYELFIKTHNLKTSVASLKAAVSAVKKLPRLYANNRLNRIEDFIRSNYSNALIFLKKDQVKYHKAE